MQFDCALVWWHHQWIKINFGSILRNCFLTGSKQNRFLWTPVLCCNFQPNKPSSPPRNHRNSQSPRCSGQEWWRFLSQKCQHETIENERLTSANHWDRFKQTLRNNQEKAILGSKAKAELVIPNWFGISASGLVYEGFTYWEKSETFNFQGAKHEYWTLSLGIRSNDNQILTIQCMPWI